MIALRLLLDTNIVVSAALKPDGLQRTVVVLALTKPARWFVTEAILDEYREVLARPEPMTGNRLRIGGKREAERREQSDTYYAHERTYGDFLRVFTLPDGVEPNSVQAELKDGVLTVSLRKAPELQPKKVPIQSATKRS
jgi:predicted nucleic acid-binding protein